MKNTHSKIRNITLIVGFLLRRGKDKEERRNTFLIMVVDDGGSTTLIPNNLDHDLSVLLRQTNLSNRVKLLATE